MDMDGFDNFDPQEVDPAAEFLAREQDQLAGLEDELKTVTGAPPLNDGLFLPQESTVSQLDPAGSFEIIDNFGQQNGFQSGIGSEGGTPEETRITEPDDDINEEVRKDEMREAAKKELEEWYRHHEDLITKTKTANRNAEKQFVAESDEIEPGTEWERIAKLCDFNPKSSKTSRDVSRMRSIILQLKQSPPNTKKA
uniref:Clathrin light chain n=1 Tax=Timema bartmani TaxID=61472 RepID=A0A7R9EZQ1_9NEOP|nr:unnamed protein product [Timema bartmani]